jgi:hypothetical protein
LASTHFKDRHSKDNLIIVNRNVQDLTFETEEEEDAILTHHAFGSSVTVLYQVAHPYK